MSDENTGGDEGGQVSGDQGQDGQGGADGLADWTAGLPDELKGYVGNKGWNDPVAAVQSYKELEKFAGSRANYIEKPDPSDPDAVNAVLSTLGAPDEASGYDIKLPEGVTPDEKMMEGFKGMAAETKMTPAQAQAAVDWFETYGANLRSDSEAELQRQSEEAIEGVKRQYGKDFDGVVASGQSLVRKLGLTNEELNAIEDKIGTAPLISLTAKLGERLGEKNLLGDEGDGEMGMTAHQAKAKIGSLGADANFRKRLMNPSEMGHASAKSEWDRLNEIAAGV